MDARQTIIEDLNRVEGPKKMAGSTIMIQCPFHDDNSPSCGINLSFEGGLPLGFFNCFGCPEKGPWNKIAKKLNLTQFKDWEMSYQGQVGERIKSKKLDEADDEETKMLKAIKTRSAIEWPTNMEWRGYKGDIIRRLGGLLYSDDMRDDMKLFFPIKVNGKFVGGVTALMEKPKKGMSYINSPGTWVNNLGLFGYELAQKLIRKYDYDAIVLVEGPRDVIRMLVERMPALAVLGVENFSKKKMLRILSISPNIRTVYVLGDNDSAGNYFYHKVKLIAGDLCKVKQLKLPRDKDKEGKVIKMDPDNAPKHIIKAIKEIITNHKHKKSRT